MFEHFSPKQEEDRLEKVSRRTSAVEEVRSTTKHLRELLEKHRRADLSSEEQEEMKVCSLWSFVSR